MRGALFGVLLLIIWAGSAEARPAEEWMEASTSSALATLVESAQPVAVQASVSNCYADKMRDFHSSYRSNRRIFDLMKQIGVSGLAGFILSPYALGLCVGGA